MGAFSKVILSGSTDGLPLTITGVAVTTANLVHTAITGGPDAYDEVYIYAYNDATADRHLTIRWGASGGAGATTLVGRKQSVTIPAQDGDYLVVPGHMMRQGNRVYAYGTVAGTITGAVVVHGWVNRFAS